MVASKRMLFVWLLSAGIATGFSHQVAGPAFADPAATVAVNDFRKDKRRKALKYSSKLEKIADDHAKDMAKNSFFSHQGSNGSSVGDRARKGGYKYCVIAENIAMGQSSLDEVMQSWINSKGHRKNLEHKKVSEFGLARQPGNIWVMVLAAQKC